MSEKNRDLRRLLLVLFSGVACAFLVVALFLYYYGPSGKYKLYAVLLEPDVAAQLNYNDYNPKTGGDDRYVFDAFRFERVEKGTKKSDKIAVALSAYTTFYNRIKYDMSLGNIDPEIEKLFYELPSSSLVLYVHTESPSAWQRDTKAFQELQLAPQGDYYRVQLHEQNKGLNWAYFYHPKVLQEAITNFIKP